MFHKHMCRRVCDGVQAGGVTLTRPCRGCIVGRGGNTSSCFYNPDALGNGGAVTKYEPHNTIGRYDTDYIIHYVVLHSVRNVLVCSVFVMYFVLVMFCSVWEVFLVFLLVLLCAAPDGSRAGSRAAPC